MSQQSFAKKLILLGGSGLAGYLSWVKWHNVTLAVVHALVGGWLYVIYHVIRYGSH